MPRPIAAPKTGDESADRQFGQLARDVERALSDYLRRAARYVDLATGPNVVRHGLGRVPAGVVLLAPEQQSIVYERPADRTSTTLTLRASSPTRVGYVPL